jgi:hypothetical protein
MKKNNYTELFKSAKKQSKKENTQITNALRRILSNHQISEAIINKALYCPFTEPKH